jgi:hypothetical protein
MEKGSDPSFGVKPLSPLYLPYAPPNDRGTSSPAAAQPKGNTLSDPVLVHLATLGDAQLDQPAAAFRLHAATDAVGAHVLTDSPHDAELILFTQSHMLKRDWRLQAIRGHPLTRAHREKVLVYDEADLPWCGLPGVYVNMPARAWVAVHQRAFGYFVPPELVRAAATGGPRDLLFSFIGSDTAAARRPLFGLRHPDAVVEQAVGFRFWDTTLPDFAARRAHYAATLARSRFVLCPRGAGTSSIRLYEVIATGGVPVIIADDWVAPAGMDWDAFSLRWPEGRTAGLIETLVARDAQWPQMSAAARRAYEQHFSPAAYFHGVIERCAELLRAGSPASFPRRGVRGRHHARLTAIHARARLRHAARRLPGYPKVP